MKKLLVMTLTIWTVFMAGCNTVRGFGQDVERAGEAIQRGAKR